MSRCPHTATYRGRRVRIKFRDGHVVVTKFVERTRNKWIVTEAGRFRAAEVASFSDYRDPRGRACGRAS